MEPTAAFRKIQWIVKGCVEIGICGCISDDCTTDKPSKEDMGTG